MYLEKNCIAKIKQLKFKILNFGLWIKSLK